MMAPKAINAVIVTGRPTGKNHSGPVAIRSIKKRAAIIVSIRGATRMKGLLYADKNSVRIIHAADIDTSEKSDHLKPLLVNRSTIVQTAIPEKAIIPLNSQRYLLFSFL